MKLDPPIVIPNLQDYYRKNKVILVNSTTGTQTIGSSPSSSITTPPSCSNSVQSTFVVTVPGNSLTWVQGPYTEYYHWVEIIVTGSITTPSSGTITPSGLYTLTSPRSLISGQPLNALLMTKDLVSPSAPYPFIETPAPYSVYSPTDLGNVGGYLFFVINGDNTQASYTGSYTVTINLYNPCPGSTIGLDSNYTEIAPT